MKNYKNFDQLPKKIQKTVSGYFDELLNLYPNQIKSIAIYGSAVAEDDHSKASHINSVVIFDQVDLPVLDKALKLVFKGINKKIAAPLFLTKKYIQSSLDVFPVEFLDIKENHVLIYGEDIFSVLDIHTEHLRLFCEQQIKGRLIRIRQAYLEVGLKKRGIEALLKESLNSLFPIFRNLIRLKGQTPPFKKEDILVQLCSCFSLDQKALLPIVKDQDNDERIDGQDVKVFLETYLKELQKLSQQVDQL